jgi:predicted transcriptional regulator
MELTTIEGIKKAHSLGLVTAAGAVYLVLEMEWKSPQELQNELGVSPNTIYMAIKKLKDMVPVDRRENTPGYRAEHGKILRDNSKVRYRVAE